jgi:DNA-binding NtrC family response regulator
MKQTVMVVDDNTDVLAVVSAMLKRGGFEVITKETAAELKESFTGHQPEVILLDLVLPDGSGLELLPLIKKQWPETEVIVLTGHATLDAAVEATKKGAYHFQKKPFDHKTLLLSIERAIEHKLLNEETSALRRTLSAMSGGSSPIFQSPAIKSVVRTVERIAPSEVSVLITGESGTGKEIIADLIHGLSPRNKGPLIKINCAALPRELIESELFGSAKGAFTGANTDRDGLFRQAEGGSLLLDELSEMPVDTQSKLLRVLQEKEVRPVGGRSSYKTDCRILASTNRPIEQAIKQGKLREDLYYRISTVSIALPPLRDRREDILPLAAAFLKRFSAQAARNISGFSPEATDLMLAHNWPGNVRQLQNEVQRSVLLCDGITIAVGDLSITDTPGENPEEKLTLMEVMERTAILDILKETHGNKLETARRLGIGRQTLYNKIKAYNLEG